MIDNLEKIITLLVFDSEDDFYHLQIIKRKKENPELGSNSYIVKTYYIRNIDQLRNHYGEIKCLCDFHNARGCINLNRRSFKKLSFQTLKKVSDQILNEDYKSVRKAYNSVCGVYGNEPNKSWIIDIDHNDYDIQEKILDVIEGCNPKGGKYMAQIPTKNGIHFITKPFNLSEFQARIFRVVDDIPDIHKNNPTILYIP
jgi:hypothetical protein